MSSHLKFDKTMFDDFMAQTESIQQTFFNEDSAAEIIRLIELISFADPSEMGISDGAADVPDDQPVTGADPEEAGWKTVHCVPATASQAQIAPRKTGKRRQQFQIQYKGFRRLIFTKYFYNMLSNFDSRDKYNKFMIHRSDIILQILPLVEEFVEDHLQEIGNFYVKRYCTHSNSTSHYMRTNCTALVNFLKSKVRRLDNLAREALNHVNENYKLELADICDLSLAFSICEIETGEIVFTRGGPNG